MGVETFFPLLAAVVVTAIVRAFGLPMYPHQISAFVCSFWIASEMIGV